MDKDANDRTIFRRETIPIPPPWLITFVILTASVSTFAAKTLLSSRLCCFREITQGPSAVINFFGDTIREEGLGERCGHTAAL